MQVCVVVQSAAFLTSAGARIRYKRFANHLPPGVTLEIKALPDLLAQTKFQADAYVFVKVFNSTAMILFHHLHALGKWVGHDLFDDYFSQHDDSRLVHYRSWLAATAPVTDFAICTTPQLLQVVAGYCPQARLAMVPDPYDPFDPGRLKALLERKARRLEGSRHLRVVWFGIGDNPFFPVGLQDLSNHAGMLAKFRRFGWTVELKLLTNRRAMSPEGMALIRSLPLPTAIEEWSEAAESAALEEGDVAFLPVAGQSFSRAKSLNRAITSLCRGCQVLSAGFPLYQTLDEVLYRSVEPLLTDLAQGRARLRAEEMPRLMRLLGDLADPVVCANDFALAATPPRDSPQKGLPSLCVVHGMDSTSENHKLAGRLKALSVRSPFHKGRLHYGVRFDAGENGYDVFVERSLIDRVDRSIVFDRLSLTRILEKDYARIDGAALGLEPALARHSVECEQMAAKVAAYPKVIAAVTNACRRLFPGTGVVVSENSHQAPPRLCAA